MIRTRPAVAVALAAMLWACGDEPTQPLPTNDDPTLSGRFRGSIQAVDADVALTASLTLRLTESAGGLVGTFALEGTLEDSVSRSGVAGYGPLVGTVTDHEDADVFMTGTLDGCPAYTTDFTGTYFRRTGILYIGVAIAIVDETCTPFLSYPVAVSLVR
jgi:hypothetical protein